MVLTGDTKFKYMYRHNAFQRVWGGQTKSEVPPYHVISEQQSTQA